MAEQNVKNKYKKKSKFKQIWIRFRKNKAAMVGLVVLILLILSAIFADYIVDYEAAITTNMAIRKQGPSWEHLCGTDNYGRDIFSRIVFGGQTSLFVGIVAVVFSLTVGAIIGAVAGYYGGKVDNILMRLMDMLMAIPSMLLAISLVAAFGTGVMKLLLAMGISQVPKFARLVRSSILSVKSEDYIEAAKACGTKNSRIIFRHIIPNAMGPIIVQATLTLGLLILTISSLSFVGLGIQPPTPEWGSMLAEAKEYMSYCPHMIIFPALAILLTVMSLNLMGDGLRDALDPKLKN